MKLTNIALIVSFLFVCFMIIDDVRTQDLQVVTENQLKLNQVLDNAVEDAVIHLVEMDSVRDKIVNKEEAVNQFFTSTFINLDIMENPALKNQFRMYVPVIAVVEENGFYIHYAKESQVDEARQLVSSFTDKISYVESYGRYQVNYTLDHYIYVRDLESGQMVEGDYHDVSETFPLPHFLNERLFDDERRRVITSLISDTITRYINQHNKIAKLYGIQYEFSLPKIEQEEWYRTIDDISLVVLFQGYPYGGNMQGIYNRVLIGGARVRKDT